MKFELYAEGKKFDVEVTPLGEAFNVSFGGKQFRVQVDQSPTAGRVLAHLDRDELEVTLEEETESMLRLKLDGQSVVLGRAQANLGGAGSTLTKASPVAGEKDALTSPLFGKVVSVEVKPGDAVDSGQSLLVVEAMKMESVVRSDGRRRIKEILVKEGQAVTKGQVLMRFSPGEG